MTASQPDMVLMLHKLRSAHIRWRAYAYGIINGLKVTQIQAPVDHRLCTFGEWYHGPGERHFGRFASFAKLDEAHKLLHLVYAEIYKGVLLGGHENPKQKERFGNASRYLLDTLDFLESEVTRTRTDHGREADE